MNDLEIFKKYLEQELKLELIKPNSNEVCFAFNNHELRDDFKISFSIGDVEKYLENIKKYPALAENKNDFILRENSTILFPKSTESFWKIVQF